MERKVYKLNLEFYYKSLVLYLVFLFLYVVLKGSFSDTMFEIVFKDPIIYIATLFIIFFLILMVTAYIRRKEMVIEDGKIIIKNRFGQREINFSDIISIRFSRQRRQRKNKSSVRLAKLKLAGRKRLLKIRLGEFENEEGLYQDLRKISKLRESSN